MCFNGTVEMRVTSSGSCWGENPDFFVLLFFWNLEMQNYFREDIFSVYTCKEINIFLCFEAQGKEK